MKHLLVLLTLMASLAAKATTMNYDLRFDAPKHEIYVTLTLGDIHADNLLLKMPVWAPGYYLILDSPKHVSDFEARDAAGRTLEVEKQGKNGWNVKTKGASKATITYTVFANRQSVGEAKVDEGHAFLQGNEVYLYLDGQKDMAATITLHPYAGWMKCVSGLKRTDGAKDNEAQGAVYYAKNFDTLVDSPIYIGNPTIQEFDCEGHHYTLSITDKKDLDMDKYVSELKSMISATNKLMGGVPYDDYTFLWMEPGQGGLEHLNSQACYTDEGLYSTDEAEHVRWMNFATHEYFHLYNVKSIRPFELGPFNYDAECYTDQLWISEGITVYYEFVLMMRAGLASPGINLNEWAEYMKDVEETPGRHHMTLARSSYDIWLNFFPSDENRHDRIISYYVKGPVVGGMLDLAIRQATGNKRSIDDLMRRLYNHYYVELGRGFHPEEFWQEAENIAGYDLKDIKEMVYTTNDIDYQHYLDFAGLTLDRSQWTLTPTDKPSKLQASIRKAVFGL